MKAPFPHLPIAVGISLLISGSTAMAQSERMVEGEAVYKANCARCHSTGVMGAPITGSPTDWEDRSALWEGVLMEHANEGWLNMPAKGGEQSLSEYDVDVAAEYMLTSSHPDLQAD